MERFGGEVVDAVVEAFLDHFGVRLILGQLDA